MLRNRLTIVIAVAAALFARAADDSHDELPDRFIADEPSVENFDWEYIVIDGDTIHAAFIPSPDMPKHTGHLREEDFVEIAEDLGIEPATIRAVVEIETGQKQLGFHEENKPVINYDLSVFRRTAARRGISLSGHKKSEALKAPQIKKYGSTQAAQWARLNAAMEIDSLTAIESTFWGMFQIGGFNWKLCGTESPDEFVRLMSRSEYDQLRLFANFLKNTDMVKYLKAKNWAGFASKYNGPGYAARGYHKRLAKAYKKYNK